MLFLCTTLNLVGQSVTYIDAYPTVKNEVVIKSDQLFILPTSSCSTSIRMAIKGEWSEADQDFFPSDTRGCYWLKVKLKHRSPRSDTLAFTKTNDNWMVEAGHHGFNSMYVIVDGVVVDSTLMGNDLPLNQRAYPHIWSKSYLNITPLSNIYGSDYELLFRYANPRGQSLYGTNDKLEITLLPEAIVDQDARLHLVFSGLILGGLLLLFFYQLTQWVVYRSELGITYCFMLLGLMSYILYDDFMLHAVFSNFRVSELWLFVSGSLGLLGFFRFARLTLRAVDFVAHRDRVLGVLFKVKLGEVAAYLILALFAEKLWSQEVASFVPESFRILLMLTLFSFSWVVIAHYRANKDSVTRAFMYGNLSLVVGVMIVTTQAYILPYADIGPVRWYLNIIWPVFDYIIEAGIVGMALCFAFAVAMLTKEREVKIERAYNRRLIDVEMKALRAQMNPHFLFNGLNSIKSFVIDNKRHEAADYLSKFARLIRRVLENSKASLIPLSRELETLDYYVEMESMRFDNKFSYSISSDPEIDVNKIQVPPTLIQPFVENSIWHGLLLLEERDAYVRIHVGKHASGEIQILVEDNGIGRKASESRKANMPNRSKSLGMEITAERIAMLKELHGFSASLEVIDLFDKQNIASGTRVVISINEE